MPRVNSNDNGQQIQTKKAQEDRKERGKGGGREGGRERGATDQGDSPVRGILEGRERKFALVSVAVDTSDRELSRLIRSQEESEDALLDPALKEGGREG
jgi:hypothetical protein